MTDFSYAILYGSTVAGSSGAEGDQRMVRVDNDGFLQLSVDPASISLAATVGVDSIAAQSEAHSTALAASLVVKASAGDLYGVSGFNNSGSDQYIQIHNTTSLPANGAVPIVVFKVAAGQNFAWDSGMSPYPFSTGITVCNSSTIATKTIGAADCWFNAVYQ